MAALRWRFPERSRSVPGSRNVPGTFREPPPKKQAIIWWLLWLFGNSRNGHILRHKIRFYDVSIESWLLPTNESIASNFRTSKPAEAGFELLDRIHRGCLSLKDCSQHLHRYMIRDHLHSHPDAKEVDPIHVGLEIEQCKFYFSKFNMRMLTIEQCLYGNGLDIILTAFAA